MVKSFFEDKPYVNLEHPKSREFALNDPELFLEQYPGGVVIDEVQRVPKLLSYIQVIVDARKIKSMFVLTGSQQFTLIDSIKQSLAGRTGMLTLLPFSIDEIHKTIQEWISILQASYIIFLLPYYAADNIKKQVVKSPKLYFYDSGLAAYLLDIHEFEHIINHPLRGALFENLVIAEALKYRFNRDLEPNLYFYRDKSGKEVDLLYKVADKLTAIEIKVSKTFHESFFKNLDYFEKLVGEEKLLKKAIVYSGEAMPRSKAELINPYVLSEFFDNLEFP